MEDDDLFARTKGSVSHGKIVKGTINDADFKVNCSSIPSRLENVITRSQTISAFGSGVDRFTRSDDGRGSPGPGAYAKQSRTTKNPSFAKSGYGPMQSKMSREMINKMKSVPGPGSYNSLNPTKQPATKFAKFQAIYPLWKDARMRTLDPGPASYEKKLLPSKSDLYSSIFKSNVKRNQIFMSDAPNASTYRPKIETFDGRSFSMKKPRTVVKKDNVFNSYFGEDKEPVGPGAYNPEALRSTKAFTIKETGVDRFGRVKEEYRKRKNVMTTPGPGTYEPPILERSTRKLRSMFQSQTDRHIFEGKEGPTYFATSSPKRDFHTNPHQKWI